MSGLPLVSALMPTADRPDFVSRAIDLFLKQDYPNLELVIYDNGEKPIDRLVPVPGEHDPAIRYIRHIGATNHGKCMNFCTIIAHGEICIVWDDDDVYPANRISRQVEPLIRDPQLMVSGTSALYYYNHPPITASIGPSAPQSWVYECQPDPSGWVPWMGAIAYTKDAYLTHGPFDPIPHGADLNFLNKIPHKHRFDLRDPNLVVCAIHSGNTANKPVASDYFKPVGWEVVTRATGGVL